MKIFINSFWEEEKRMLKGYGFWASILLTVLILLTFQIYKDEYGNSYSVITAFWQMNTEQLKNAGLLAQDVFFLITRTGLAMYGAGLAALSFAGAICQECRSNSMRYLLFRSKKRNYILSKALATLLTSGIAFVLAAVACMSIIRWFYPDASQGNNYELWLDWYSNDAFGRHNVLFDYFGGNALYILQLVGIFLYGCLNGAIGFMITAFSANIYVCVCIPFFFGYFYYSVFASVMVRYVEGKLSQQFFNVICNYGTWESYIVFWRNLEYFGLNIMILALLWAAAVFINIIHLKYMKDCGEKRK